MDYFPLFILILEFPMLASRPFLISVAFFGYLLTFWQNSSLVLYFLCPSPRISYSAKRPPSSPPLPLSLSSVFNGKDTWYLVSGYLECSVLLLLLSKAEKCMYVYSS